MKQVIKNSLSLLVLFTVVTVVSASDDAEMAAVGAAARDILGRAPSRGADGAVSPSVTAARAVASGDVAVVVAETAGVDPRVAELERELADSQAALKAAKQAGKWQLVLHKMARKNLGKKMRAGSLRLTVENEDLRAQVAGLSRSVSEVSTGTDLLSAPMMRGVLRREETTGWGSNFGGTVSVGRRVKIKGAGPGLPSDSDSEGSGAEATGAGVTSATGTAKIGKQAARIAELERELAAVRVGGSVAAAAPVVRASAGTVDASIASSLRHHGVLQTTAALTAALATGAVFGARFASRS